MKTTFKMFDIILFCILGIVIGILTGLTPGLHPNTIFIIILSIPWLASSLAPLNFFVFIVSLSIANTFFDFIPSIFFGAPEEDTVMGILPGHKMLIEGKGYEALFLSVVGGFFVTIFMILILPLILFIMPVLYPLISKYMAAILIFISLLMIVSEKKKITALAIFMLAGIFGMFILSNFPQHISIFPALTGLFGISTLIIGIMGTRGNRKIKSQSIRMDKDVEWKKGTITGLLGGIFSGIFPGVGISQSGVIAAQVFRSNLKDFIVAIGGINTSNIIVAFIIYFSLGKIRSGSVWALTQALPNFTHLHILLLIAVSLFTASLSAILTLNIGRHIIGKISHINYEMLTKIVIFFLLLLVFLWSGIIGVAICLVSTLIGILTVLVNVRRACMMAYLLVPTILYFTNLYPIILSFI
ncbi:MAG TPA: hypothetical protein ENG42_01655 [Candidatus Aenigmarchaeota archaeon]|nr:MAG: hypothetical protein DRP03_01055 [Candidatus Aenigmarchaeota archaeon]HDD46155.1 hypothetical protein [Candidatus Aenigmarchaeota archaeon]